MQLLYQVLSSGEHNAILCQYPGTGSQEPSVDNSLGSVCTRCWALSYYLNIPFFQVAMQNPNMVLVRPCFRAQKWEPGPCLHTVFVSLESTTF